MYLQDSLVRPSLLFYVNLFIYKYIYNLYMLRWPSSRTWFKKLFPELLATKSFSNTKHRIQKKKIKRGVAIQNLSSHQPSPHKNTSPSFGLSCSSTPSNTLNTHMPVSTEISSLSDKILEETVSFQR